MGTVAAGVEPETNPDVERLLREQRTGLSARMDATDRRAETWVGATFALAAAGVLLVGGTDGFDVTAAIVLLAAYAGAGRVRFEIGGGATDPTLLVLIPAFFLEPPATVPLLAAAGFVLSRAPDYAAGRVHPERALTALGNSWHAIGPALVLALAVDPGRPAFDDAGWYVLAAAGYVVCDMASGLIRQWTAHGVRPQLQLRMMVQVYALDALLAPVGLLAALATAQEPYAFLLAAPLLVALGILSRERGRRLDHALALSESRGQILEAELEATRIRVEVLGAVSLGLQTPVAGIVGIAGTLARKGPQLPETVLVEAAGRLQREGLVLRQLVRQALDYVRLVDDEPIRLRVEPVDIAGSARDVAALHDVGTVHAPDGELLARADAARVHQILWALVSGGLALGEPPRITVEGVDGGEVRVSVTDVGPAPDAAVLQALMRPPEGALGTLENQGTGIDLYVAGALAHAMDGTLAATADVGGGTCWTLTLPAV